MNSSNRTSTRSYSHVAHILMYFDCLLFSSLLSITDKLQWRYLHNHDAFGPTFQANQGNYINMSYCEVEAFKTPMQLWPWRCEYWLFWSISITNSQFPWAGSP